MCTYFRVWKSSCHLITTVLSFLSSATSYLPLGVDDPKSKTTVSDLTVSLFNGAQEGTVSHGSKEPLSMAVVCANFTTLEQERLPLKIYNCCSLVHTLV